MPCKSSGFFADHRASRAAPRRRSTTGDEAVPPTAGSALEEVTGEGFHSVQGFDDSPRSGGGGG